MVDLLYPMNDNNNVSNSFNFSRHEDFESFRSPITGNNGAGPSASASASASAGADANANASASVGTSGLVKKPRKKRSKVIEVGEPLPEGSSVPLKPKPVKKPQTGSPNSTRPCSECGKQFWSWKALFGHMRCHPERHWRGINPPPNLQKPALPENNPASGLESTMTYEDHEVANCLIMLASGSPLMDTPCVTIDRGRPESRHSTGEPSVAVDNDGAGPSDLSGRFECTSCKKVFGSHQALGGHRASHKNVKGCFAIARTDDEDEDHNGEHRDDGFGDGKVKETAEEKMMMVLGHKCDICLRVFSSGQALGGHKRCHWEKGDEPPQQSLHPSTSKEDCVLDLNLPAPIENNGDFSTTSSELALDLKLGI